MAYELPSRVVQAAGERTGVRARAIAGHAQHILLSASALCAGGRRPARSSSARHPVARPPCGARPARSPCGARPARPLADRAASFARRVASKPGQALQASRHSPVGPPPFGTADTSPAGLAPPPIGQSHPMSGTKLSQHTTKRLYQAISRLQGELCTAQSTNKPSRENFVPHTGPPPGRNSPRTKPGGPNRYKTLPAGSPNGPPGTKLSQHTTKRRYQAISRLQGELFHAYGRGKPSRENFVPHTGPPPGRNSPRTKPGGPNRYKTLPAGSPNGPPGTKLSQHTTKRRYQAISRLQGELFHAYGRGKPSRENFVPHTGPLAGQNSPRSTHQPKQRDKTLPARHKTLILACFTHAGRVLSRI